MTSDTEYAEKIIKTYERRKKRAAFFALISIIFAALAYISYVTLDEKNNELTSSISSALIEGRVLTEGDIGLVEANNQLSYVMGLRIGQTLNALASASGLSLGYCLYLLFWSRKERIIKDLYEKAKI